MPISTATECVLRVSVWPIALAKTQFPYKKPSWGKLGSSQSGGIGWAAHDLEPFTRRLWCHTKGEGIYKEMSKGNLLKHKEQDTKRREGHGQL